MGITKTSITLLLFFVAQQFAFAEYMISVEDKGVKSNFFDKDLINL